MAKKTFQQIDFFTGVVDGTLAYDFDVPAYYPEEETVYVPKRRRTPKAKNREWVREEPAGREKARESEAAGHLQVVMNAVSVVGVLAVILLLSLVLLAKIQLVGISTSALAYEAEISALETEYSRLTAEYEQVFNLKDIEEIATGTLGMQEPREDQIYYISGVSSADKAVVITHEDAGMFSLGLEDIVSSAHSYFDGLTTN